MERDFTELEKLSLFAEIILASGRLPSQVLLRFMNEISIEPSWSNIALPTGRTLAQCQRVFHELRSDPMLRSAQERRIEPSASGALRYPPIQPDTTILGATAPGRPLQPRPPELSTASTEFASSPRTPLTGESQQRKRGRPTKAETEERRRVAEARGESLPPSRPTKRPKPASGRVSLGGPFATVGGVPTEVLSVASSPGAPRAEPVSSYPRPEQRQPQPSSEQRPPTAPGLQVQPSPASPALPQQQYRRPESREQRPEGDPGMQLPRPSSFHPPYAPEQSRQSQVSQPTASPLGPPTRSFPSDPGRGRSSYLPPPPPPPPPPTSQPPQPPPPPPQTTRDPA